MCPRDPARFAQVLRQLGPVLGELVDLRESDPELFWRKIRELHLEATIEPLASSIRTARARGDTPDPALEAEFRALVEAQIAAALSTRQLYLDRMRSELDAAETELARQADDFGHEVTRRMQWLLKRKLLRRGVCPDRLSTSPRRSGAPYHLACLRPPESVADRLGLRGGS